MKNVKYLVIALVVSMMLVGAAYASWNDTIYVNGTVTTGKFDVNWQSPVAFTKPEYTEADMPTVTDGGNSWNIALRKLYPGAVFTTSITLKNDGTIPAIFDSLTVEEVKSGTAEEQASRTKVYDKLMIKLPNGSWQLLKSLNSLNVNQIAAGATHKLEGVQFKLDDSAGNDTQNITGVAFKITVNWKQ